MLRTPPLYSPEKAHNFPHVVSRTRFRAESVRERERDSLLSSPERGREREGEGEGKRPCPANFCRRVLRAQSFEDLGAWRKGHSVTARGREFGFEVTEGQMRGRKHMSGEGQSSFVSFFKCAEAHCQILDGCSSIINAVDGFLIRQLQMDSRKNGQPNFQILFAVNPLAQITFKIECFLGRLKKFEPLTERRSRTSKKKGLMPNEER